MTILSPIPMVKAERGVCTICDSEWRLIFEHSNYPGMKVCRDCLGTDAPIQELKTRYDVWEPLAIKQGRELVPRV